VEKLYLTERQDIIGAHSNRARFADILVGYGRAQAADSPWQQIGTWVLIGMTGRWQKTLALWEWADGWDGFSRSIEEQMMRSPGDLAHVYEQVEGLRSGGECFVMRPSDGCPTVADLDRAAVRGSLLAYETAHVPPGTEDDYLTAVEKEWAPTAANFGYTLIGNYAAAKSDGVVFTAWLLDRADHARLMRSAEYPEWQRRARRMRTSWQEELWIAAAGSRFAGPETAALF
jgi:hypothetical protein